MDIFNEAQWFKSALRLRGSVVLKVLPRIIVCGLFGALIAYFEQRQWIVSMPALASLIPNIVLGLLLVFRTNTAYDRFWEGRKCWGMVTNNSRNLARQIWVAIELDSEPDRAQKIAQKIATVRLLEAFALALKQHLRQGDLTELQNLISPHQAQQLNVASNAPLEIIFWISDYLQTQCRQSKLHVQQLTAMQGNLDRMVEALGGCERILKTPMPMAYAIHLKQLLLLYCLSLPFQMVGTMHSWTPLGVMLVAFMVFGIEAIGTEIENPFGQDPNDLPLNVICQTIGRNIEDMIALEGAREPAAEIPQLSRL
jgi:ion channel-forming bestrophin family protein